MTTQVTTDPFIFVSQEDEEGIEAPKVLGDIFESVAGAVFLDSGMDLATTWVVYYRMIGPYISKLNLSVLRRFRNISYKLSDRPLFAAGFEKSWS